jgi:Bacterial sugar transferase
MVRPGITGWAQINGGNLITKEEKGALDDWYIRHASLWLDARIALFTLRVLFRGERQPPMLIASPSTGVTLIQTPAGTAAEMPA